MTSPDSLGDDGRERYGALKKLHWAKLEGSVRSSTDRLVLSLLETLASLRRRLFVSYQGLRVRSPALRRSVRAIPGAHRLHRRLYESVRPTEVVVPVNQFSMVVNPRDEVLGAYLIHGKPWEPFETKLFIESIQPGMVVVDIGANIGYYSLLAAEAVGPGGRVVAFEPDPVNFRLLVKNVTNNGLADRVTLVQGAVGDRDGRATLFHDRDNLGAHSLVEENLLSAGFADVQCFTLAEALRSRGIGSVDLLKMDVQGSEGLIFAGAQELFERGRLRIFMEYWPSGLRQMGTDPEEMLRRLTAELRFEMSWIDEDTSQLVQAGSADEVLTRCGAVGQVNLVLDRL